MLTITQKMIDAYMDLHGALNIQGRTHDEKVARAAQAIEKDFQTYVNFNNKAIDQLKAKKNLWEIGIRHSDF